jgi:hypothetical protein
MNPEQAELSMASTNLAIECIRNRQANLKSEIEFQFAYMTSQIPPEVLQMRLTDFCR